MTEKRFYDKFSPEEDAVLLEHPVRVAAERLGRSVRSVSTRKYLLRQTHYNKTALPEKPRCATNPRFARPSWFNEDLKDLTKGAIR